MRTLGLDYGEIYLGVALAEDKVVTSLTPLNNRNWESSVAELAKILAGSPVDKIILGQVTPPSPLIKKFAAFIEQRTHVPVTLVAEDYSSQEALERSLELGTPPEKRRHLDSLAAAIILERYLVESDDHATY